MSDCDVSRMEEWMAQPDLREPTRQQKCAELARAMGWRKCGDFYPNSPWRHDYGFPPTAGMFPKTYQAQPPPDPFTDHEACHALLAAMVSEDSEIDSNEIVFLSELMKNYSYLWQPGKVEFNAGEVRSIIFRALTADPAIIAEAAWQSIQPTKQETT